MIEVHNRLNRRDPGCSVARRLDADQRDNVPSRLRVHGQPWAELEPPCARVP